MDGNELAVAILRKSDAPTKETPPGYATPLGGKIQTPNMPQLPNLAL